MNMIYWFTKQIRTMRILLVTLLLFTLGSFDDTRTQNWIEDIDFYEKTLRKNHKSLFHFLPENEFNQKLATLKSKIDRLSDYQVVVELSKISAAIGDGHTYIHTDRLKQYWLPLRIAVFEEGFYVLNTNTEYEELMGGEIIAFGEKPISEVIENLKTTCATDLKYDEKDYFAHLPVKMMQASLLHAMGLVRTPEKLTIKIQKAGKVIEKELISLDMTGEDFAKLSMQNYFDKEIKRPVSFQNTTKNYWFTYLKEAKAMYLAYNSSQQEESEKMDEMSERLVSEFDKTNAEKLVIDVRRNGGGNSNIHKRLVKSIINHPRINQKGNLIVLMGSRTFSAANIFILDFEKNANVITIGEHGRGKPNHYSENHFFTLPNSKIRCSVSELYRVDSHKDDTRIRIEPMVKVLTTFQDFSENRDAVLEAALSYQKP
jgi:hypothetical protein